MDDTKQPIKMPTQPTSNLFLLAYQDPLIWTGAPLAILLQFAAPGIALGSCAHSRFATHPLSRLRRTVIFIAAIVHGTPDQQAAICGAVRRQHAFVRGQGYDARDAELQRWTAATIFVAMCKSRGTFGGKGAVGLRSREERGELCREFGRFATVLDMPAEMWPASLDEFERYYEAELSRLERGITEESGRVARMLLFEMVLPWWLRWMLPIVRVVMVNWLPPTLREAYGLPDPAGWAMWSCYHVLVCLVHGLNQAMPAWAKGRLNGWIQKDMARAAHDIRRTGRWMV
ncbi:hypothetical protein B0T25DRAFT_533211 [Lasiosphaeria hispida]|uniref:ER-bound oxygenase mpaB/mpaB'/Rubber oxygenase catalytic domain-containing protein n=1 Tax=Lasiosphaeria hispida TaxID=260671 RepID=A0AAJ0HQD7_9PEZI|nr:hypothetical protein B0T25DRAFT_533211 [Lasiosphaeria hispida]